MTENMWAPHTTKTCNTIYIQVDRNDILRAELTAILKIVQHRELDPKPLRIITDSLTSIRLVRRWMYCPTELSKTDNLNLLDLLDLLMPWYREPQPGRSCTRFGHTSGVKATSLRTPAQDGW